MNSTLDRQKNLLGAMGFDNIDWRNAMLPTFAASAPITPADQIFLMPCEALRHNPMDQLPRAHYPNLKLC